MTVIRSSMCGFDKAIVARESSFRYADNRHSASVALSVQRHNNVRQPDSVLVHTNDDFHHCSR